MVGSIALVAAGSVPVAAQSTPTGAIRGQVWDSTVAAPLEGARVRVEGSLLSAISSADGSFEVDGLRPGDYRLYFRHPRLASLRLEPTPVAVTVATGPPTAVALGTPSMETLLLSWCGAEAVAIGGVVRDLLTGIPAAGADVVVSTPDGRTLSEIPTDGAGLFRFCGAPAGQRVSLRATFGPTQGRWIAGSASAGSPWAQPLYLTLTDPVSIEGRVLDGESLDPVEGATVRVARTQLGAITSEIGEFRIVGVPSGTIVLETTRLAYAARTDTLSAQSGDELEVTVGLSTQAVALEPIVVTSKRRAPDRRAFGMRFDGMDRAKIDSVITRASSTPDLLRLANIPGLQIRQVTFRDPITGMYRVGACIEKSRPRYHGDASDCAMVEVFVNDMRLPNAHEQLLDIDPTWIESFQLLSGLEASARYGGPNVHNGVLLIYTRN